MPRKTLYSVRQKSLNDSSQGFVVTKCDLDFNPSGTYEVDARGRECNCFAGNKPICRHREVVQNYLNPELKVTLLSENAVHTYHTWKEMFLSGWWFEYDRERWVKGPSGEL